MKNLSLKTFFIIDAIGALISFFSLGFLLVIFQPYVGIPKYTLYTLAFFPFGFFLFDVFCLIFGTTQLSKLLKIIAYLNISYCALSIVLVLFHINKVTFLGWMYIVMEIAIVLILAKIELRKASSARKY